MQQAASTNCGSAESPKFPCRSLLSHRCRRPPDYLRPERKIESSLFVADSEWPTSPAHSRSRPPVDDYGRGRAGDYLCRVARAPPMHAVAVTLSAVNGTSGKRKRTNEIIWTWSGAREGGREPAQHRRARFVPHAFACLFDSAHRGGAGRGAPWSWTGVCQNRELVSSRG